MKAYHHEYGKRLAPRPGIAVDVGQYPRDDGDGAAPAQAAQQAEDEQGGPAGGEAAGEGEGAEEGEGGEAEAAAAEMLAQGAPDEGAEDVADEVDGYGEGALAGGGADGEAGGDAVDCHAREGGAHGGVYDEHAAEESYKGLFGLFFGRFWFSVLVSQGLIWAMRVTV